MQLKCHLSSQLVYLKKKSKRRKYGESGFEEWGGYMAAKKQKLEIQFEEKKAMELMDRKETKIFKGICIFVNGYTDPPADELKRLMLFHGGTYHHYFSSKTTHVIASNLPKSKMKQIKTKTFVTANWITDSIKAGKLLSYHNYLLYTPEIADKQQRLDVENYFQKKSCFSSDTASYAIEKSNWIKNKKLPTVEELFGEDLDSDSNIDSDQNMHCSWVDKNSLHKKSSNAFCVKNDANNFSTAPSPLKSFSNVNVSLSAQNQTTLFKDSLGLKPSLSSTEIPSFNESNFSTKEDKIKSTSNESFREHPESDYHTSSEKHIKSIPVNMNSSYKASYQKHVTDNHIKVSSSNVDISLSAFSSNHIQISPLKSSSDVNMSMSSENPNVTHHNSSHFKSSPIINVSNISGSTSSSNKESYSKPSKRGYTSLSPLKVGKAIKAGDPNFLPEFFNHSRKHHISTSAQELKRYVQLLVENNKGKHFPKRDRLRELSGQFPEDSSFATSDPKTKGKPKHFIMHLDMDCFFVAVGLKKYPELKGVPVAVTHSKGKKGGPQEGSNIHYEASHYTNESKKKIKGVITGNESSKNSNQATKVSMYSKDYGSLSEVASCSYEARKAGVRNGLFLGEALRRCPNLQTIPYDFEGYSEVSKQLYDIVSSYTLDIEAVSCDELYIDCTELLQDVRLSPHQFSSILRAEIEKETGCTASAGMGSNMLLARLATKVAKPNGQHYVYEKDVEKFMKQQKVGDLPGVGYATVEKLKGLNIRTCGDLQSWSLSKLQQEFGPKTGQTFYNNCRGKDDKVVKYHKDRKSVSAEVNYGIRFETEEDVCNFINELSTEVQNRIQNLNCKGNQVTLKLMARKRDAPVETAKYMGHGVCDNYSKSIVLKSATDSAQVISKECYSIARSFKINPQDYRGVGIQLSKLVPNLSVQRGNKSEASISKQSKIEPATDMNSTSGVFAPKHLNKVNKVISEKSTISHFLSNKSSPPKKPESIDKTNPVKAMNISPLKQSDAFSKHSPKTKTIENFLSNKPSTSRAMSYNITDYLPEELDQSVLEALPEDLKREILESCKPKAVENERKTVNQNALTSKGNKQNESIKSLSLEPRNEECVVSNSNSLQSKLIGLDQSFLNALPDDLRKEVLDSYNFMSNKTHENVTLTSTVQQPSTSFASKSSNSSELTLKKNSSNLSLEKPSNVISEAKSNEQPMKKTPSLAGAVEIDDVKALIKEWIESTDDPLAEDVNDLKIFLLELCEIELVNVEKLLKYLYRMAKGANQKWKNVYLTVLSSVQGKVSLKYKSTLMLSSEFPI